ncbi:SO2930 family diheme c-type cytochrome [Parasphingorhabdus sp.]|uniref:SO2930 family diheme c-type cytochrome n=1 Tax=Parasphingorhabdus sp. TaxID=2709688 RepID=UPI00359389F0
MRLLVSVGAILGLVFSAGAREPVAVADAVILSDDMPGLLSDYQFFRDEAGWQPNDRVISYQLNMPLFTDYAEKYRFIYVPPGQQAKANGDGMLDFPVGSALIKSFGYEMEGKPRLLETRVLLHRADGWLALPYVWNEEQTEARLKVAGARIPVRFTDPSGQERVTSYAVPNKNQCKECHALSGAVTPIGPKARNLTGGGQLAEFARLGLIDGAPSVDYRVPVWGDAKASLNDRARGYLDVNCAHCHNINGSASNSGLFLTYEEQMPVRLGINKRPVAAGRGSGTHDFDIAPGDPDGSIMIYRLNSLDPGISMPEVGRSIVHDEGVALLRQWIAEME